MRMHAILTVAGENNGARVAVAGVGYERMGEGLGNEKANGLIGEFFQRRRRIAANLSGSTLTMICTC